MKFNFTFKEIKDFSQNIHVYVNICPKKKALKRRKED